MVPAPQHRPARCRNPREGRCLDSGINTYIDFLKVHVLYINFYTVNLIFVFPCIIIYGSIKTSLMQII